MVGSLVVMTATIRNRWNRSFGTSSPCDFTLPYTDVSASTEIRVSI
jgi:hypothetical protein